MYPAVLTHSITLSLDSASFLEIYTLHLSEFFLYFLTQQMKGRTPIFAQNFPLPAVATCILQSSPTLSHLLWILHPFWKFIHCTFVRVFPVPFNTANEGAHTNFAQNFHLPAVATYILQSLPTFHALHPRIPHPLCNFIHLCHSS